MTKSVRGVRVQTDNFEADEIRGLFERGFEKRVYNPLESNLASDLLRAQIDVWRREGSTIVFTSGVYDLLHANHRTFLLHTKLAAMPYHFRKLRDEPGAESRWEVLSASDRAKFCEETLARDSLKLIVSVDGNATVAVKRGTTLTRVLHLAQFTTGRLEHATF